MNSRIGGKVLARRRAGEPDKARPHVTGLPRTPDSGSGINSQFPTSPTPNAYSEFGS